MCKYRRGRYHFPVGGAKCNDGGERGGTLTWDIYLRHYSVNYRTTSARPNAYTREQCNKNKAILYQCKGKTIQFTSNRCQYVRGEQHRAGTIKFIQQCILLSKHRQLPICMLYRPFQRTNTTQPNGKQSYRPTKVPSASIRVQILNRSSSTMPILRYRQLRFPRLITTLILQRTRRKGHHAPRSAPCRRYHFCKDRCRTISILLNTSILLQ